MSFLSASLFFYVPAVLTTIVAGVVLYLKYKLTYWQRKGVPTLTPSLPYGDTKDFMLARSNFGEQFEAIYKKCKSKGYNKHAGIYLGVKPFYVAIDPALVQQIMQKDFAHFMNHGFYVNEHDDPLSANLFNLEDQPWRNMRVKLTPTFTSGKMKMMFQTLVDCTHGLKDIMDNAAKNNAPVDIKEVLGRFTTDIIGSAAFGIECNSLKNPDAEFRKYGKKVFEVKFIERMKFLAAFTIPHNILKALKFKFTKSDVETFFTKMVHETVAYRESNNIYRKDFMHLLLQLKNRGNVADDDKITESHGKTDEKALTMSQLTAQAFVFFVAGFETSSTLMTFALYLLATNPKIQEKLREEINAVLKKHNDQLTYDSMMDMTYLEQVLNETLRLYPPVPVITRKCNKDYVIPNTSIVIKKGTDVAIPTYGIQRDPEFYPNPNKFDPDRFSEENKHSRPNYTWLPFGEGPRICIGLRFGMMQSKVGLTTLLRNYRISLSEKTKLPLEFDKLQFILTVKDGVWIKAEKIV